MAALSLFVTIVESGSLSGAARRTGYSPAVVTRMLQDLETQLGVRLLERTTRKLALTDAGHRLAEHARRLVPDFEEAMRDAAGEGAAPQGRLRVSAPLLFGQRHIAPIVARYLDAYPQLSVELHLSDRIVDLVEEGIDVALRIGHLAPSSLIARRVGAVRRAVASPTYLERADIPAAPADLAHHDIVLFAQEPSHADWIFAGAGDRSETIRVRSRFQVDQMEVAIAAALDGRGIAAALSYQVAEAISAGRLVRILKEFEAPAIPVQLVFPTARLMAARVRAFLDLAVAELAALSILRAEINSFPAAGCDADDAKDALSP